MTNLTDEAAFIQKRQRLRNHGIHLSLVTDEKRGYGVVFPGHGSQYIDMLSDHRWADSVTRDTFDEADAIFEASYGSPLSASIYGSLGADTVKLSKPTAMQCSIFTASVAQYRRLVARAPVPDLVLGHSLGEFAAYVAGGVFTLGDGMAAVMARAEVLSTLPLKDRGTMVAVRIASPADERAYRRVLLCSRESGRLTEAIVNSPSQRIVSGLDSMVDRFCTDAHAAGIRTARLPVTHAFHSPVLQPCVAELRQRLSGLSFRPPRGPIILSTITHDTIDESDLDRLPSLLAMQLVHPFNFDQILLNANELGVHDFVEPGPGQILTGIIDQSRRTSFCFPFDARRRSAADNERNLHLYLASIGRGPQRPDTSPPAGVGPVDLDALTAAVARSTGYPSTVLDPDTPLDRLGLVDGVMERLREDLLRDFAQAIPRPIGSMREIVHSWAGQVDAAGSLGRGAVAVTVEAAANEQVPTSEGPRVTADLNGIIAALTQRLAATTGYPIDLIGPDLDLEADLGIDSVKQAQVIAAMAAEIGLSESDLDFGGATTVREIAQRLGTVSAAPPPTQGSVSLENPIEGRAFVEDSTAPDIEAALTSRLAAATGYPADLIEPDLDLEADLGIDSVKQAQVIAAMAAEIGLSESDLDLGGATTVREIAQRLRGATPSAPSTPGRSRPASQNPASPLPEPAAGSTIRYVPRAITRPLPNNPTTGQPLSGQRFVVAASAFPEVNASVKRQLEARGASVWMFVHRSLPTEVRDSHTIPVEGGPGDISRQLADAHKTTGQATGIVYLAGLGEPVDVLTLPKDQFEERWRKQYSLLFAVSREYYRDLIEAGIAAVFAAVTNTGGAFGLKPMETGNALGALGVGFAKSLAKEIPNLRLRCIDIGRASFANAADLLVSELSADDSATDDDIAYIGGQRHVIKVVPASLPTATALTQPASTSPGVVVFSGGSRGIALECAIRLAELSDYRIALLGRSTLDDPLSLPYLHQDDQRFLELQPTILRKLHDTDPDLKPVELQLAYRRIANNRRLFQAIARLRSRSLPIEYVTCDVTDLQQVKGAISDISRRLGTVRGVVHAAGLESLGLLPKKDYAYGEQLVGVKVSGLYNLVNSVSIEALDFLLAFTSISGRFGMDGQTDYTAASAMLSTLCSQLATRYRDTRIVAMDWTAWSGTGMATHESVRQIQEGERGLTYMDPEEGCAHFLRELSFGGANSQVMVFGSLGSNEPRSALDCLTEDRRTLRSPISRGSVVDVAAYPLIDTACDVTPEASSANFREYTRRIDPRIDHFMEDHAVRGIPTLPAVFHLEIMTEAARLATGTESLVIQTATFKRFVKCRHERTCDLLVETRINGDEIVAEVFADVVDPSGSILVRKQPRSRSVLTARPRVIDPGFFTTHQGDVADRATTFDLDAYYEAAAPYIAFGPSFRLLTDAWRTSKGIVAGWFQIPRNSRLWLSPGDARLSTEPVLVDSVGRLALIDVYDKYGDHVVPVELTGAVVLRHALPGSQVLGRVKVAPEGDDSYSLTLLITDPDGDPFLKVDRILLRRIGHDDAHQGLAKTRH